MLFKSGWLSFCLFLVMFVLLPVSAAHAKDEKQPFSLPQASAAPSSAQIPFQLSEVGVINVKLLLESADRRTEKMIFVSLHQKGNPFVLLSKYYKPGQAGVYLRHEVLSHELAGGGDYFISLQNYSTDIPLTGEVQFTYPVVGETETIVVGQQLPNLTVTNIHLDEKCKVQVTLKNQGPGELPLIFWKRNMPELALSKDGKLWGTADIRFFDYGQALNSVGGESLYNSSLKVIGSVRIRAVVDVSSRVKETLESDNSREMELVCK